MSPTLIPDQVVERARALMAERTKANGAPAWGLTELVVAKGEELAKSYDIDPSFVKTALYLAHIVFSKERDSEIMKNHMRLSAQEAEEKLMEWGVSKDLAGDIRKAIELHHTPADSGDIYSEVVKNAECFKFLTIEGIRIFMADLKTRGFSESEIQEYARYKIDQKYSYLTLDRAKLEAETALRGIEEVLDSR